MLTNSDLQSVIKALQADIANVREDAAQQAMLAKEAKETLRDKFAGQALQALLATSEYAYTFDMLDNPHKDLIVKSAYEYADAMLKERSNG